MNPDVECLSQLCACQQFITPKVSQDNNKTSTPSAALLSVSSGIQQDQKDSPKQLQSLLNGVSIPAESMLTLLGSRLKRISNFLSC